MESLVSAIVTWSYRRRLLVVGAVVCSLIVSLVGVRRLAFDSNVLSLLPRDNRVIQSFREFLARFGSLDQLYVVFTAPEGHSISAYDEEIGSWVTRLRAAPEIRRVDAGVVDRTRDFGWLADHQLLLLGDRSLDQAFERLRPQGLAAAVAAKRELLTVPSPEIAELIRQDPAGLFDLLRDGIGGSQAGFGVGVTGAGYVTPDGHSRLVIARPARPPYDAEFSRALDARLREIDTSLRSSAPADRDKTDAEPQPPPKVEFAGGHRIAVETEAFVRSESISNTVGSLALILPLLFFAFRSFWLVVVGSLPSALSLVYVLGGLGFAGVGLSAAATGAAAMLFGLGVDGVVLLYVAHRLAVADDPTVEVPEAISGPSASMLLGMFTTAATFYGLLFVDFPSLQQLGLLIGHSMVICGILTLVMVPALLPRRPPRRAVRALLMPRLAAWIDRRRGAVLVLSVVLTVALGFCATRIHVNPTLERLRSVTDAAQLETKIGTAFGLPSDVSIVMAEGPELQPLLETNERLAHRLSSDIPGLIFQPPTRLLPSASAQAHTVARIARANLSPASVGAALEQARVAAGFTPGAFDPFAARLPHLLDPGERLSYEGYLSHGLDDLIDRFVVHEGHRWTLATYVFPSSPDQLTRVQRIVNDVDATETLTGLTLVNRELAKSFLPQFIKGLVIGTLIVIVLVVAAFRDWRLSAYALLPTAVGLVWTAGVLALAGVELDLFAVFAVVSFVGIGVDYGVHLVHRYHERGDAVRATAELAPVILMAAAITLLGYGTLVTSSYPPLRSIGVVSTISVIALAAASVLFLPAMLLSEKPAGATTPPAHPAPPAPPALPTPPGLPAAAIRAAALIPAANEAATIAKVVRGVRESVARVFVVDDGSRDGTAERARGAGADVIVHETNRGKGHAVRTGLARILAEDFTHVLLLDGDLQHLPDEASALLAVAAATGAEVVVGERRFDRLHMPASRYYANKVGSRALSWFVGVPIQDTQCGFRVFKVEALRGLQLSASGYEIETEMLVKVRRHGGCVAAVPVTAVYGSQRSKLRPVRDTTRTCFLAVYCRFLERL